MTRNRARQRDYFAGRGEAVGWQTRAHDEPADLTARLRAAGFAPQEEHTVLIGRATELATAPVLPGGVVLRWLTASADSAPILRRLGFRAVTTTTTYVWTPPHQPASPE